MLYDSQNFSPRELQAIGKYAERSLPKLRHLQDIIRQQQKMIMDNDIRVTITQEQKEKALFHLDRLDLILIEAVLKKEF